MFFMDVLHRNKSLRKKINSLLSKGKNRLLSKGY